MSVCEWPEKTCACFIEKVTKPDYGGRVWMHCEEGLTLSKASMSRFVMYCLLNRIEIGQIFPLSTYRNSQVSVTVLLLPEQFEEFELETKGKLKKPPTVSLN